jgi:hypothetical protein
LLHEVARSLGEPVVIQVGSDEEQISVRVSAGPVLVAQGARGYGVGEVVDYFLAGVVREAVKTARGAA